jgi:hypothetical protein
MISGLAIRIVWGDVAKPSVFGHCPAALLYDSRTYETGANIAAARMMAAMSK